MDWQKPLIPQSTAKTMSSTTEDIPHQPCMSPVTPIRRFTTVETSRPVAMKRRMLQ